MSGAAPAAQAAGPGPGDAAARAGLAGARHLSRQQLMGMAVQFLLGMAVNLLGLPAQTTGAAHAATLAFLAAHIVVSAGMLAVAFMIVRAAARTGDRSRRLAIWGAAAIVATIAAGILTLITNSNWWSYAMAVGFIASLLIYGGILVQGGTAPAPRDPG